MLRSLKPMLTFVIESELLIRLDDFRFKHRFVSRAAAINCSDLGVGLKAHAPYLSE